MKYVFKEIPNTPEGKEQIKMYEDVTGISKEVTETLDLALQQQVDELCKTFPDSCDTIEMIVETEQDLQELHGWIGKGKKIENFIKHHSKQLNKA